MSIHPAVQNILIFIGRIFISLIFIMASIQKLINFPATVSFLAAGGLPLPFLAAIFGIGVELIGGLMILLGWYTRIGALLILIFTLFASFFVHHFWTYSGAEMDAQFLHFFKNLVIVGACLYIISFGAGTYSMDQIRHSRIDKTSRM